MPRLTYIVPGTMNIYFIWEQRIVRIDKTLLAGVYLNRQLNGYNGAILRIEVNKKNSYQDV